MSTPISHSSTVIDFLEPRRLFAASVTGYLPDYQYGIYDKLDYTTLTTINYFSLEPDAATGNLPGTNGLPAVSSAGYDLTQLTNVVTRAHANDVKVNIVIGGAGSNDDTLDAVIADTSLHQAFADSVQTFADTYNVDGVDLDWEEYDTTTEQVERYAAFIDTLRNTLQGLTISAAVYPEGVNVSGAQRLQLTPGAINDLDQVNVMAYDFEPTDHSPVSRSQPSMNNWAYYTSNSRNPKTKLIYGLPFYARGSGSTWQTPVSPTEKSYAEVVTEYKARNGGSAPAAGLDAVTLGSNRTWYFNGRTTIENKTRYANDNGFGGVMIWDLGHDVYTSTGTDGTLSLMAAIKRGLGGGTAPTPSTGSISGKIMLGTGGMAGMQVYVDADNDGQLDTNERRTLSDIQGNYTLTEVTPGNDVIVRQVMRPGYRQTKPTNNLGLHVIVKANQTKFGANFTNASAPVAQTGTVTGSVTSSGNAMSGVTVFYDIDNDQYLDTNELRAVTGDNGVYTLANVPAGSNRIIRQVIPSGYYQGTPGIAGHSVTLSAGQTVGGRNFSNIPIRQSSLASIKGNVFNDGNGNGTWGSGETGISGWKVFIDGDNDGQIDASEYVTTTGANGAFTFSGLQSAGTYKIRVIKPTGFVQTNPTNNFGRSVTVASGQTVSNVLFGAKKV